MQLYVSYNKLCIFQCRSLKILTKFFSIPIFRSSRPEVFCKKDVLTNFATFIGNTCARVLPATLLKKKLWHRYFPKNFAFYYRTPLVAASGSFGRKLLNYTKQNCYAYITLKIMP